MIVAPVSPSDVQRVRSAVSLHRNRWISCGVGDFGMDRFYTVLWLTTSPLELPVRSVFGPEHFDKVIHMGRLVLSGRIPTEQ